MPVRDEQPGQLTKNTAYMTAAFVVQKVLAFAYFLIFANLVGTENAGAFFFAVSFANLFGMFIDLGLSPIVIRDVARDPGQARAIFSRVVRFKLLTAVATLAAIAGIAPVVVSDGLTRGLLVFAAIVIALESFALTAYGVLRGLQLLRFEAIGTTLSQVTVLSVGTLGLLVTKDPLWLGIALLAAGLVNVSYATVRLRRSLPRGEPPSAAGLPWSARTIRPFFLSGVFIRVYAYADTVLLGLLSTSHFVGLYGAVYRITYSLQFLPIAFNTSVYPALSRAFAESHEALQALVVRSIRLLTFVSLPISTLIMIHARPILALIAPRFVDAATALQVSIASVPFLFLNLFLTSLLNATNRQVKNTIGLSIVVAVNVALNLVLIPLWQHVGASVAALASTASFSLYAFTVAREFIPWRTPLAGLLLRLGLAILPTVSVALFSVRRLEVLPSLALSGAVYLAAVLLFRVLTVAELRRTFVQLRRRSP